MKQKPFNPKFKPRQIDLPKRAPTIAVLMTTYSGLLDGSRLPKDKFKPRRLTLTQRYALQLKGVGQEMPFTMQPDYIPKTVTDDQCDLCGELLPEETAQCFRCGNCVFCGAYQPDRYQNGCMVCGNNAPGRTDDTDVMLNL